MTNGKDFIPSDVLVKRYVELVKDNEGITNAEIAEILGMKHSALVQALARARKRGALTIWRVGVNDMGGHHYVQIARRGERNGTLCT